LKKLYGDERGKSAGNDFFRGLQLVASDSFTKSVPADVQALRIAFEVERSVDKLGSIGLHQWLSSDFRLCRWAYQQI